VQKHSTPSPGVCATAQHTQHAPAKPGQRPASTASLGHEDGPVGPRKGPPGRAHPPGDRADERRVEVDGLEGGEAVAVLGDGEEHELLAGGLGPQALLLGGRGVVRVGCVGVCVGGVKIGRFDC